MKLWQAILTQIINEGRGEVITKADIELLFEKECYKLLEGIKGILEDDRLDDKECFERIEDLVCLFEERGSSCGGRHDFG